MLAILLNYSPRRALPIVLLFVSAAAGLSLLFMDKIPWQGGSMRRLLMSYGNDSITSYRAAHQTAPVKVTQSQSGELAPLDVEALRRNFPRLKEAAKRHSGPYSGRVEQMMTRQQPVVNTQNWRIHSPGGRLFTVSQVQAASIGSMQPGYKVPNVAHFILPFGDTNLQFHHMVSILSCLHVMRPHRLLLWYASGRMAVGEWWERVRKNLTDAEWEERVIMAERPIPTSVYTVPVHVREHQSDVMRMEAVLTFGGVYMDIDVFVLKPLEPLRKFPFTIGREVSYGLCNGVFMSAPNGTFLAMWHTAYQVFNDASWVDHSVWLPNTMRPIFPDLCHVEEESMDRPNWTPEEVGWIYNIGQQTRWDWRAKNYVMHLWYRKYNKQHNMDSIKTLDSMFGQMCRYILFGTL